MSAVVAGAGPAHALYFSSYEYLKETIQEKTSQPLYVGKSFVIFRTLYESKTTLQT